MNEWLERWIQLRLPWRAAWLLALSLLVLTLGWLLLLLPQQRAQAEREHQLRQLTQQEQQRQQQLAAQPDIAALRAGISVLQQPAEAAAPSFTLEAMLAARGSQLDSWQAESQPQHISLRLGWDQFIPLFAELADTLLPVPERFQLQAGQGELVTQLWLESGDAQ